MTNRVPRMGRGEIKSIGGTMFGFKEKSGRTGLRAAVLAGATVGAIALGGLGASSASACSTAVHGEGSSLQKTAQISVWNPKFGETAEGCAVTYTSSGSGAGLKAWGANGGTFNNATDQFIGTDDAPFGPAGTAGTQLNEMTGAIGSNVAVVPVTQTAIAIMAHPPTGCTVLFITPAELEKILSGEITSWDQLANIVEIPKGACKAPITRVVRKDGSGTSYQLKHFLDTVRTAGSGGALPCIGGSWAGLQPNSGTPNPNTTWPEGCGLSSVEKVEGGGGLATFVNANEGTIGYAALPDAEAKASTWVEEVDNGVEPVSPAAGGNANCAGASYGELPVGAENADWSQVYGSNPEVGGTTYPICTLTWDVAAVNSTAVFSAGTAASVKGYLTYVIAEAGGQADVSGNFYAALPGEVAEAAEAAVATIH